MMEHKGYVARVDYDDEAGIFHGEIINTKDVITFQAATVKELRKAFRDSVQDYFAFCEGRGEQPEKPFSGQFVARLSPDLHRRIYLAAALAGKSLNAWVAEQLERGVQQFDNLKLDRAKAHPRRKSKKAAKAAT